MHYWNLVDLLVTKYVPLNNESCITRPYLVNLNQVELHYYSFIISLDKCSGNCNAFDDVTV